MTKSRMGSLFFLLFSSIYFYQSFTIRLLPGAHYEAMTARTFPYYLGLLGMLLSFIILILSFVKKREDDLFDWDNLKTFDFQKGLYFVLAMVLYGYTIRTLGFMISTVIFLILGFLILGERRLRVILLTSVGVSVVFWFLLTQVLGVYIQQGIVFDYILGAQS